MWHIHIHLVSEGNQRSLRSSSDNMCSVPCAHNSFGDRSFGAAGPQISNSLPHGLRTLTSATNILIFKTLLKTCFDKVTALCDILYKHLSNILTYLYVNNAVNDLYKSQQTTAYNLVFHEKNTTTSCKAAFFCCWSSSMEQLTDPCPDIRDTDSVQELPQNSLVCLCYISYPPALSGALVNYHIWCPIECLLFTVNLLSPVLPYVYSYKASCARLG